METGVLRPAIGAVVAVHCRRLRAGGQFRGSSVCPRPQNYAGPANHCLAAAPRLERLLSVPRVDRGVLPFRSRAPPFAVPFWADLVKYPRRGGVAAGRPSFALGVRVRAPRARLQARLRGLAGALTEGLASGVAEGDESDAHSHARTLGSSLILSDWEWEIGNQSWSIRISRA